MKKRAVPAKGEDSILVLYDREEKDERGAYLAVRLNGPLARQVIDFIEANATDKWDMDYDDLLFIEGEYVVDSAAQLEAVAAEGGVS